MTKKKNPEDQRKNTAGTRKYFELNINNTTAHQDLGNCSQSDTRGIIVNAHIKSKEDLKSQKPKFTNPRTRKRKKKIKKKPDQQKKEVKIRTEIMKQRAKEQKTIVKRKPKARFFEISEITNLLVGWNKKDSKY